MSTWWIYVLAAVYLLSVLISAAIVLRFVRADGKPGALDIAVWTLIVLSPALNTVLLCVLACGPAVAGERRRDYE